MLSFIFATILILGRFAIAKLLRMSYTERNSSIKFANMFRFGKTTKTQRNTKCC